MPISSSVAILKVDVGIAGKFKNQIYVARRYSRIERAS